MAYRSYGTESNGTGAVTYPLPSTPTSWVAGDLLLLIVETGSELPSAPAGWQQMTTVENPGQTRLTVFWRIAVAGDTAPTVADAGDHQIGHTAAISGVDASRPWDLDDGGQPAIATSILTTASTAVAFPSVTTTTANCQVAVICSTPADSASWPFTATGSAWVNAALTGFGGGAGYFGHAAVDGNGGAFGGVLGVKASAGAVGSTTTNLSGGAQQQARITIALRPPAPASLSRMGSLSATSALTAAGLQTHVRGGSLSASSELTVVGPIAGPYERSGSLSASSGLTAAGLQTNVRSGSLSAVASLTAAPASSFARGAFGAARVLFGTAAGTVSITLSTAASGSTVFACVGGRLADLATAMTDSRGNAWTLLYTEEYARWAGYGIRVYRCIGLNGGAGHVFSQQFGQTAGFDECTIAVYEQRGAAHVESTSMVERGIAASLATGAVTSQAACAWLVFFSGDAPTGSTAALTPNNGLAILDQSTGIDHPNGYVPIVILAVDKPAGSHASTIGITPSQGAIIFAAAIQELAVIARTGSLSATASLTAAGLQAHARSGSISGSATFAATGRQSHVRSGSLSASSAAAAAGAQTHVRLGSVSAASSLQAVGAAPGGQIARTGSLSAASTLAAAGVQTHVRSGSLSALSSLAGAGLQRHVRSGAISTNSTLTASATSAARPPRAHYTTTGARTVPSTLIAGDLEPDLLVPLYEPHATIDGARQPIDLTGVVSVALRWAVPGATTDVMLPAVVHGAPTSGEVAHTWVTGETAVTGVHRYRVELIWPGGEIQTVPSDGTSYTLLVGAASISG